MTKVFLSFGMLAFAGLLSGADPVPQWGRWERVFTARETAAPDLDLAVEFTSPSGNVRNVRGFWDGGATWRVRFSPDEAGSWKYRTSSQPKITGLDGQAGDFMCSPSAPAKNPFLLHGASLLPLSFIFRCCLR